MLKIISERRSSSDEAAACNVFGENGSAKEDSGKHRISASASDVTSEQQNPSEASDIIILDVEKEPVTYPTRKTVGT